MYYLEIISLEGCPYSIAAEELVKTKKIKHEIIKINHDDKQLHKNNKIDTFPQIYLRKDNSTGRLLVGGYQNLDKINIMIDGNSNVTNLVKEIKKIISDDFNKKSILRMIELIK
jgi:glutaredoxin